MAARLGVFVHRCFLDGAQPLLHAALDAATDDAEVVLVPCHVPPDRYLDTWRAGLAIEQAAIASLSEGDPA